jgi:hypothetical protein
MTPPARKDAALKPRPKHVPGMTVQRTVTLPDGMRARIAGKAYELWEQRGHREGHDLEDWFDAEAIVLEEIHGARE